MPFFQAGEAQDSTYQHLRDAAGVVAAESKAHVEDLWSTTAPFSDPRLPQRARQDFHSSYWELLLAASLIDAGLPVARRNRRRHRSKGPDIQVGDKPVKAWVEATAVTAGQGADLVPAAGNRIRTVPDDAIKLRLLAAVHEKHEKYKHYLTRGVVQAGEPYIIAINAALVPSAFLELTIPRIVRCLFPFGHEVLELNLAAKAITGSHHEYSDSVTKASGAPVSTDAFERSDYAGISAVLYSSANVWNPVPVLGGDLILVHNPFAASPVPRGFLPKGIEYWKESGQLRSTIHRTPVAQR